MAMTPAEKAKLKKELSKGRNLDKPTRSKSGASALSEITKRFGITAREARDIATAVSTAVSSRNVGGGGNKFAVKDIKTQIKEVGTAALTGKKGTTAAQSGYGGLKKGTIGAGNLDQNVSKRKRK